MPQVALVSWAMQRVSAAGFMPHGTPDLVRATVLEKCGFQPRGDNTQVRAVFQTKQLHQTSVRRVQICKFAV